jgi:helicase
MRVRDLPLGEALVDHYEAAGIETLYPPQAAAVDAGVCDGDNVVAAVPTASGKTFIAELAMVTADGPALYIVPLRALAREKYESFSELPGVDVGVSTGDFDAADETLAGRDIVVATSEKVDSAIRNGASWVEHLACVVVDEVHLLGSRGRGPTLEVTLSTLRRRTPDVQIVALSATVENPGDVADWLDATLVESDWRPVDLRTGVFEPPAGRGDDADGAIGTDGGDGTGGTARTDASGLVRFDDGTETAVPVDPESETLDTDATIALAAAAVADGGQCLAFVRSRREAEALAEQVADADVDPPDRAGIVADDLADVDRTGTGRRLTDCVRAGVAFHHAGLRSAHRAVVESAFRNRDIAVICATPTLAAGVNVPARRVVVRDLKRYTGSGMDWLPVLEVHQMCGRAGRPHLDPYGEAVLVGDADGDPAELRDRYVGAQPEAVESKLAEPSALRTHVLSVVASGFAGSRAELLELFDATFYAHQARAREAVDAETETERDRERGEPLDVDPPDGGVDGDPEPALAAVVDDAVADLVEMGMVTTDDGGAALTATELGAQVSRQYVTPESGARIVAGLDTLAGMDPAAVTSLSALELVCHTPDMQTGYLGNRERASIYQFAREHAAELTTAMGEADDFEGWLKAVKTARILGDLAEGATVEELTDTYRIGPGDLESRVERATWLLGAADALRDVVGADVDPAVFRDLVAALEDATGGDGVGIGPAP